MELRVADFGTIDQLEKFVDSTLNGAVVLVDPKSGAVTIDTNMCVNVAGHLI